jgi:hypothetical protein
MRSTALLFNYQVNQPCLIIDYLRVFVNYKPQDGCSSPWFDKRGKTLCRALSKLVA